MQQYFNDTASILTTLSLRLEKNQIQKNVIKYRIGYFL